MNQLLDPVRSIEDRVERFRAATATVETARTAMAAARQIRQDVVNELRDEGMGLGAIATLLGQTRSRVQQIREGRTGGKPKAATEGED